MKSSKLLENITAVVALITLWILCFLALMGLTAFVCSSAKAADYDYVGPHHFNVVFSPETTAQEVVWQALNVVDGMQTVYIAQNPDRFEETGVASVFVGAHPSRKDAVAVMALFAVAHYAVTVGIENMVQQDKNYRGLQRLWQGIMIGSKAWQVIDNHMIGIKP